jgi:hypothetical protein
MPLGPNELLEAEYSLWSSVGWISSENADSFLNGGFYSTELVPGFQLLALNTVRRFDAQKLILKVGLCQKLVSR